MTLGGRTFFSFFNWTMNADGNSTSNCGLTILGWYHDDAAAKGQSPKNWGCWMGKKAQNALVHTHHAVSATHRDISDDEVWIPNRDLARSVNAANLSWKADEETIFGGLPIKKVVKKIGRPLRRFQNHDSFRVSKHVAGPRTAEEHAALNIPVNFTWRNVSGVDYVGPLRDQGDCGSCYAHR